MNTSSSRGGTRDRFMYYNFGLTCYGDFLLFMPSEVYCFNHSGCEKLYKVKLLIVPRK